MRNARMTPDKRERGAPVQYFAYGPLEFNINRASILAANRRKYRPQYERPTTEWIGPLIDLDRSYAVQTNLSRPVLFATLALSGHPPRLLIDGNHRVVKALETQSEVPVIVLDLEDTLKIVRGPVPLIEEMKQIGRSRGLLKPGGTP